MFSLFNSQVFGDPDAELVRQRSAFFSLMFVVIGGISFLTYFGQVRKHACLLGVMNGK